MWLVISLEKKMMVCSEEYLQKNTPLIFLMAFIACELNRGTLDFTFFFPVVLFMRSTAIEEWE